MTTSTTAVAGVTFIADYPADLGRLQTAQLMHLGPEGLAVVLIRNPDNEHDTNAIQVHVPVLDEMIGHVPARLAARLAPIMDRGVPVNAEVVAVRVSAEAWEKPGCDIKITYTEEP